MKKKMYIIIATLIYVIIFGFFIRSYFRSESYFRSQLPEKYKSYPSLNENVRTANYQIKPLFTGARPKLILWDSLTNSIIVQKMEDLEGSVLSITYYRISSSGQALDSLNQRSDSKDFGHEVNGHLIYDDGYSNFLRKGNKQKLSYKNINQDLTMSPEALTSLLTELSDRADAVSIDTYTPKLNIFIISIDGEVQKVFTSKGSGIDVPSKFPNNFNVIPSVTEFKDGQHYDWKQINAPINIDYFLKQKYTPNKNPAPFSPAPMSSPAQWTGTGYFHLKAGEDTLKFQHPMSYMPDIDLPWKPYFDNREWGRLNLFNHKMINFQILTVGYNIDFVHKLDGCYLVIPIVTK